MKFITEKLIEQAAEMLHTPEEEQENIILEMRAKQPVLLAYFFSDTFQPFTQEEREYLFYLTLVIWKAIGLSGREMPSVTEEQLGLAEEANWEKMQEARGKSFHERLNPFFENYPQEDLLAFVEDALAEEEEGPLATKESREAMFVCLKSVIDCLAGVKG